MAREFAVARTNSFKTERLFSVCARRNLYVRRFSVSLFARLHNEQIAAWRKASQFEKLGRVPLLPSVEFRHSETSFDLISA